MDLDLRPAYVVANEKFAKKLETLLVRLGYDVERVHEKDTDFWRLTVKYAEDVRTSVRTCLSDKGRWVHYHMYHRNHYDRFRISAWESGHITPAAFNEKYFATQLRAMTARGSPDSVAAIVDAPITFTAEQALELYVTISDIMYPEIFLRRA